MTGYKLTLNKDREYPVLLVEVFHKDPDYWKWDRIGYFRFQTDKRADYWYGGSFSQADYIAYRSAFGEFLKFAGKVMRAEMYDNTLENVLAWLEQTKVKQLVYDVRLQQEVTLDDYLKTENLTCYKIIRNNDGRYLDDVLAYSENDAIRKYMRQNNDFMAMQHGVNAQEKYVSGYTYVPDVQALINYPTSFNA